MVRPQIRLTQRPPMPLLQVFKLVLGLQKSVIDRLECRRNCAVSYEDIIAQFEARL